MTASEKADLHLDIVEKYQIKMDIKKLIVTYVDRGKKYKVRCFSEKGVRTIAWIMIENIFKGIEDVV